MRALLVLSIFAVVESGVAAAPQVPAAARTQRVTPQQARQVTDTIDRDVVAHYGRAGKKVPDAVRVRVVRDLEKQTEGLVRSGLSVELIQDRNRAYLAAIDRLTGQTSELTQGTYEKAYHALFTRLVKLTIASEPQGARVALDGHEIGTTSIAGHPVEPGKSYTFTFRKDGYRLDSKQLYIAPVPESQDLLAALTQDDGTGGSTGSGRRRSFPWHFVIIGAAVLLVAVWLLSRVRS